MSIKYKEKFRWVFPLLLVLSLFTLPASALDLAQAKAQGMVKETASGYLAAVKGTDAVKALVKDINARRRVAYEDIAKKRGISVTAVEHRAGEKATK
jgi:uncharacterized protein YdbL (DUF1318 family)